MRDSESIQFSEKANFDQLNGEVHATETSGFVSFLNSMNGQFGRRIFLMLRHEARRGDEYAA